MIRTLGKMFVGFTFVSFLAICIACGGSGSGSIPNSSRSTPPQVSSNQSKSRPEKTNVVNQDSLPRSQANREPKKDYVLEGVKLWIRQGEPEIDRLAVGEVGSVPNLEITQIINNRTALCMVGDSGQIVMVKNFNFAGSVDGRRISLPYAEVSGTTQYETVLGAVKTVFVLEGYGDLDRARAEVEKERESEMIEENIRRQTRDRELAAKQAAEEEEKAKEEARLAKELRESQFRTWETADGKFSVEARLERYSAGKVVLERRDNGEMVDVSEELLSLADQQYISEEFKRRAKSARQQRQAN